MAQVELTFTPRCGYTICPYAWTYRLALGLIESWPDLSQVAEWALRRSGYGNTDSGFGLEYPTRPEKAGLVRFWRWEWRTNRRVRTRKFHFPEADYLATLVALLRIRGFQSEAEAVARTALDALPVVQLMPSPDPYDLANYSFKEGYTHDVRQCMRLILDQRDFSLAAQRAVARKGFAVMDGSRLEYLGGGKLRLYLQRGHTQEVSEELYVHLLENVQRAVQRWDAAAHT